MTPERLNEVLADIDAELEATALEPLAAEYEKLLRKAGREMAKHLRGQATSLTAAFVAPDPDEVIDAQALAESISTLTESARTSAADSINYVLQQNGIAWDVHGDFTPELIEQIDQRSRFGIEEVLRKDYRNVIVSAGDEGWSIPRTADEIVASVDATASQYATAMARTDLIGLANGATQNTATDAFAGRDDVSKQWLSTDDERTRDSHVDADGQIVPLNSFFMVGGWPLRYPGDPFGPDDEIINCRCTLLYLTTAPGVEKDPLEKLKADPKLINQATESWSTEGADRIARNNDRTLAEFKTAAEIKLRSELARAPVRIRTPRDTALRVAQDGRFKSQFESGGSRGLYSPTVRSEAEKKMFGYPRSLPEKERPVYGYLGDITDEAGVVESYGDVVWELKPEARARTTFANIDSLNSGVVPSPVNDPSILSIQKPFGPGPDALKLDQPINTWGQLYWEAQIHGGVSLDDVAEVLFIYYNEADKAVLEGALSRYGSC